MTNRQPEKPQKYGQQPRLYLKTMTDLHRPPERIDVEPITLRTPDVESGRAPDRIVPSVRRLRLDLYLIYEDEYGKKGRLEIREQRKIRPDDEEVDPRILEMVAEGVPIDEPPLYEEVEDLLVSTYWYRRFISQMDPRLKENIISEWNEVEYLGLSKKIGLLKAKSSTLKELDPDAAEGIDERINRLKAFKRKFINWFEDRGLTLPDVGKVADEVAQPVKSDRRRRELARFPVKPGTQWHEVKFTLLGFEKIRITAPGKSKTFPLDEIGFAGRSPKKTGSLWDLLMLLATHEMVIDKKTAQELPGVTALKNQIKNLRKRLKYIISIDDNPIPHIGSKYGGEYRAKFEVSYTFRDPSTDQHQEQYDDGKQYSPVN